MIGARDRRGEEGGFVIREQSADFRTVTLRNIIDHGQQKIVIERTKVESPYAASTDLYLALWRVSAQESARYGIQFADIVGRVGETVQVEFVSGEGLDHILSYLSKEDQQLFLKVSAPYLKKINETVEKRVKAFFNTLGFHEREESDADVSVVDQEGKSGWWFVLPGASGADVLAGIKTLNHEQKLQFFGELLRLSKVVDPFSISAEVLRT